MAVGSGGLYAAPTVCLRKDSYFVVEIVSLISSQILRDKQGKKKKIWTWSSISTANTWKSHVRVHGNSSELLEGSRDRFNLLSWSPNGQIAKGEPLDFKVIILFSVLNLSHSCRHKLQSEIHHVINILVSSISIPSSCHSFDFV